MVLLFGLLITYNKKWKDKSLWPEGQAIFVYKKDMTKIRIPLSELNSQTTQIFDENPSLPDNDNSPIPADAIEFRLLPVPLRELPDYNFAMYSHPALNLNVTVPNDDLSLVRYWLGYSGSTPGVPSDTLINRMTNSVTGALKSYVSYAERRGLFTSPFKIGFALTDALGNYSFISTPMIITPATQAPLMAIRESELNGSVLRTVTEIINTPVKLQLIVKPFGEISNLDRSGTLVIYASRQTSLLDGNEVVNSIRAFEIFGERIPCWNYNRMAEDMVLQNLQADNSFRVIGQIPVTDLGEEVDIMLPMDLNGLEDWNSLPVFDGAITPDRKPSGIHIETIPLDLYRPEEYKRVRGVTLRGIFNREVSDKGVHFSLYGSQHRQNWHKIASARGAHMRFLRTISYRWYKVSIDAPYPSQFDAITFLIK